MIEAKSIILILIHKKRASPIRFDFYSIINL